MNDLFGRWATRIHGTGTTIGPRPANRFEPSARDAEEATSHLLPAVSPFVTGDPAPPRRAPAGSTTEHAVTVAHGHDDRPPARHHDRPPVPVVLATVPDDTPVSTARSATPEAVVSPPEHSRPVRSIGHVPIPFSPPLEVTERASVRSPGHERAVPDGIDRSPVLTVAPVPVRFTPEGARVPRTTDHRTGRERTAAREATVPPTISSPSSLAAPDLGEAPSPVVRRADREHTASHAAAVRPATTAAPLSTAPDHSEVPSPVVAAPDRIQATTHARDARSAFAVVPDRTGTVPADDDDPASSTVPPTPAARRGPPPPVSTDRPVAPAVDQTIGTPATRARVTTVADAVPARRAPLEAPYRTARSEPPVVRIAIGRIDVRPTTPPRPTPPRAPAAPRALSLEDYLRRRAEQGTR